jgi:RHS repeat-associated protein
VARNHDAAGNTLSLSTSRSFTYDDRGRMAQFLVNGATSREYRYNARGERVAKLNVPSPQYHRYYVYDEAGRLLGEYRPNGTRVTEYVWLDDTLVAVFSTHGDSNHQLVLTDHLGRPRVIVHPGTNAILWRWDLTASAFGDHAANQDPDGDGAAYTFNLRYPGQYYDAETGLHYNYFRDYDPTTGRYLQSDPIGHQGGINTYAYVSGGPLSHSDPFGLQSRGAPPPSRVDVVATASARTLISEIQLVNPNFRYVTTRGTQEGGYNRRDVNNLRLELAASQRAYEARYGASCPPTAVIGQRGTLLQPGTLRPGEYHLMGRLPNQFNPQANWRQNYSVLREEMGRGAPIRDASPGRSSPFLGAERNALQNAGWTYNGNVGYWMPPGG